MKKNHTHNSFDTYMGDRSYGDSFSIQVAKFPKCSLEVELGMIVRVCEVTNDVLLNMEPKHPQGDNLLACTTRPPPNTNISSCPHCSGRWSFKRRFPKVREYFILTEKAPTRAFYRLKVPTSAFTFKTLLRHFAK